LSKPSVLISRKWPEAVEQRLTSLFDVTFNESDQPMDEETLRQALRQYDAVCPCVVDKMGAAVFAGAAIKSRIIANYGVGFNHIDLEAAKAAGITVTNTPDVLTEATADLAMCLMLMVARRASEGEMQVRTGTWHGWYPTHLMGAMVTGKTLGIIGMGRIGMAMARKAHFGFGMNILYHNRRPVEDEQVKDMQAVYKADMHDLLAQSDFVALHCPASPATRNMINADALAKMKKGAYLINTSRGDVVDETALVDALKSGHLAGAGLDVFAQEPKVPEALIALSNVSLLPHLGSATLETRTAMGMRVVDNLEAFFNGEVPTDKLV
jgi:lactate dehydrogenase-like 2-hydroxyacid dehydrogenase